MSDKPKILIVDDDMDIRRVLTLLLSSDYETATAENGEAAIEYISSNLDTDLVILDVMMPGLNGYETCDKIRDLTNAQILFLTAKSAESDRLSAYRSGGDDFLSKPFSQAELLAKVRSLLRRYMQYKGKPQRALEAGGVSLAPAAHTASRNGELLSLTETEYLILEYLLKNRGKVVTTQELYEAVWNEKFLAGSSNTVMVHVLNLRRKVEDPGSQVKLIRTVWGKGYQID